MILRYEARVVTVPTGSAILATAWPDPARYGTRPGRVTDGTLSTLESDAVLLQLIDRLRREAGSPALQPREADELAQLRRAVEDGIAARRRDVLTPKRNPETEPPSEWLTVNAVGSRLGVSESFVRRLARSGRLTAERNGTRGHLRIDPRSVELYEAERKP